MLNVTDSDIFKLQNDTGIFTKKIEAILKKAMTGQVGKTDDIIILNTILEDSLRNMQRLYNEPILIEILNAVREGRIILVSLSADYNIPKCMPFVRYKATNGNKVLVNLTPYLERKKDSMGNTVYSVSAQKLYPIMLCAHLSLTRFVGNYALPAKALHSSAYMWASMFNQVLSKTVALGTNKERYDAFMYFAMKFFCIYYMETPEQVAEDVGRAYLVKKGRKEFPMLDAMLQSINQLGYKPFESFGSLCKTLFDNRVSNLRGIFSLSSSSTKEVNEAYFLNKFVDQFSYTALFSLAAYPYFLFTILNATMKTRIVNDLSLQEIITNKDYSSLSVLNALIN